MRFKRFLMGLTVCLTLLTTGCSISREATSNRNVTQTEVVLAKKNYKVVGMVTGESSQNYWFGIGGLSKKSLKESAMSEMYKKANLTGSQAIINVNVFYKNKFILIYNEVSAIATGTVIQFVDDMDEPISSNSFSIESTLANSSSIDVSIKENKRKKNKIVTQSTKKEAYYTLTYLKKRKDRYEWDVVKEDHLHSTWEEVKSLAEKWDNQLHDKYDYRCNIKKEK